LADLAPADFLFRKVKEGLGGEGVTRTISRAAFRSWLERCKKYVRLGGEFVKKF
jgi:hypothetical protein